MTNAVADVIKLFGSSDRSGNLAMSELCDVSLQAVSNWKAEGFIPERHHYRIYQAAQREGLVLPDGWDVVPSRDGQGDGEAAA